MFRFKLLLNLTIDIENKNAPSKLTIFSLNDVGAKILNIKLKSKDAKINLLNEFLKKTFINKDILYLKINIYLATTPTLSQSFHML